MKPLAIAVLILLAPITAAAEEVKILEIVGPTMGTRYMVKIFDPAAMEIEPAEAQIGIDGLLRRINDQMSTYLDHSEITRFNKSNSTDWFEVSPSFASVVLYAQDVAEKTNGALDVTIGPLVNAWNFGPEQRTSEPPDDATLMSLKESVGYQKLAVRIDPPALKKSHPDLQIDLSSIAKGYAVDEVVAWLADKNAHNVFVEIGGEVRTSGNKAGQWWKVGIQLPDAATDTVMIAHAMSTGAGNDNAMATSGDYRNYFESDGVRYSHTIDPATGRPVTHGLASVSVIADTCMAADAWATAINVLGPERGLAIAEQENLDVLLVHRIQKEGEEDFEILGTGTLSQYTTVSGDDADLADAKNADREANVGGNTIAVLIITFIAFALVLFAMAIGVIFGRRSISGSCGGLANTKNEDGSVSCSLCSNPADACKDLRRRMQQTS